MWHRYLIDVELFAAHASGAENVMQQDVEMSASMTPINLGSEHLSFAGFGSFVCVLFWFVSASSPAGHVCWRTAA